MWLVTHGVDVSRAALSRPEAEAPRAAVGLGVGERPRLVAVTLVILSHGLNPPLLPPEAQAKGRTLKPGSWEVPCGFRDPSSTVWRRQIRQDGDMAKFDAVWDSQ